MLAKKQNLAREAASAAALILRRDDGALLCGIRTKAARSYPGYFAFPGGGVDEGDQDLALMSGAKDAERAGALRELGEETGHWALCDADGKGPSEQARHKFCETIEQGCQAALDASALYLDDRALIELASWNTPGFFSRRFCVKQFLLDESRCTFVMTTAWDELNEVGYRQAQEVLDEWNKGDALLLEPIRFILETLAANRKNDASLVERLKRPANHASFKREVSLRQNARGVFVQPLQTPTLLPATHTNTVFLGDDKFYIIDPATPYDDERKRFDGLMNERFERGDRPRCILLTHHHPDHVGDVQRVAQKYELEVWAHAECASRVDFEVQRTLNDGEILEGGVQVVLTPGHAYGHLCFLDEARNTLIAGDMIASVGSIVIDPDEGHMQTYLASLERLLTLNFERAVPSHGPMLYFGKERIREQIAHREKRLEQTREALESLGRATPLELVKGIYADVIPESMYALAARSVESSLVALQERGFFEREGDVFLLPS